MSSSARRPLPSSENNLVVVPAPASIESPPTSIAGDMHHHQEQEQQQRSRHHMSGIVKTRDLHPSTPPTSLSDPYLDHHHSRSNRYSDIDMQIESPVDIPTSLSSSFSPRKKRDFAAANHVSTPSATTTAATTTATTPTATSVAAVAAIATITPPSEPVALLDDEPSSLLVTTAHDDDFSGHGVDATVEDSLCDTEMPDRPKPNRKSRISAFATAAASNNPLSPAALGISASDAVATPVSSKLRKDRLARSKPGIERPRRAARASAVYNLCKLSGTDVHGKRAAKGDIVSGRIRRKSAVAKLASQQTAVAASSVQDVVDSQQQAPVDTTLTPAQQKPASIKAPLSQRESSEGAASTIPRLNSFKKSVSVQQKSTRASSSTPSIHTTAAASTPSSSSAHAIMTRRRRSEPVSALQNKRAVISEPLPRNPTANLVDLAPKTRGLTRELKRLRDTDEFAHIDSKPVLHTVWSNGKMMTLPSRSSGRNAKAAAASVSSAVFSYAQNSSKAASPADAASLSSFHSSFTSRLRKDATPADDRSEKERTQDVEQLPPVPKKKPVKHYMEHGLYAGQRFTVNDILRSLTAEERREVARHDELAPKSSDRDNKLLPSPIFNGLRLLLKGRDFKLPYDVFNPLPPGQSKPGDWRKMAKNRFIGDSKDYWRNTHGEEWQSKCVCTPDDGCGESCQNRIMLYECDKENCNIGKAHCTNRAFQTLAERKAQGNKYSMGVEVIKTENRGYGVRANRCFEANQIIVEYTGEIITEEECQRRMEEKYKDNECFYLMSFDQNMILDATTGSIARFVNHSCKPNCRMVKWVVHGQPRMALFAGDDPIMTGDELTYDYKFDPFSSKNMQKCLCGADNCRGWLTSKEAPQQKEAKNQKAAAQKAAAAEDTKRAVAATTRKSRKIILGTAASKKPALVRGVAAKNRGSTSAVAAATVMASTARRGRASGFVKSTPVTASSSAAKRKRSAETDDEPKPARKRTRPPPLTSSSTTRRSGRHSASASGQPGKISRKVTRRQPSKKRIMSRLQYVQSDSDVSSVVSNSSSGTLKPENPESSEESRPALADVEISDSDSISSLSDVDLSDLEEIAAQFADETPSHRIAESKPTAQYLVVHDKPKDTEKAETVDPYQVDINDSYTVPDTPIQGKPNPSRATNTKNTAKTATKAMAEVVASTTSDAPVKEKPRSEKDIGLTASATIRKRAPQRSRIKRLPNGEIAVNKKWKVVARNPKSLAAEAKANEEASKRAAEAASSRVQRKRSLPTGPSAKSRMRWQSAKQDWLSVSEPTIADDGSIDDRHATASDLNGHDWQMGAGVSAKLAVSASLTSPVAPTGVMPSSHPSATFSSVRMAMLNRPPPLLSSDVSTPPSPSPLISASAPAPASIFHTVPERPRQQPRTPFLLQEPGSGVIAASPSPSPAGSVVASPAGVARAALNAPPSVLLHVGARPPPLSQEALMLQACEARKALGSI
ncbi:Histone-lysine N-methyltransferase ASH1L [Ceratocystis lukuohia]|uniref:Histone-lysine N-methyltransferase ASH1L n=1 Tax=Ceratocystis lukuohia TaxID=2019550 RepID=A0ABR4MF05_9PEZI